MDKYVGKKLDGRYEIRELIGIGGMANVYRCYDTIDDREVAIKILKDEFLNNEEFIRRFKNESKAIAVLSHPNIVKVYDVSFGDMIQYIVMEYIDGITLKEYINQQNVLTWKETVHLVTQVLAALSHAHSKGVVHRDIKPQNMMLLSDGTIKVTDFGIARFSNSTRTMTEQAIGSVHYIAPEQAKGDITDGKTDIYSIGIMMYEMLTGKLPFDGENAVSVALMHLQVEPDAPRSINPSIPEGIEEIIVKAIKKQPIDRYQSAQDMLADIERFRMNPSVRFEYKYLDDKQPTKYIDAVNKGKSHRAEEYAKVVKDKDDEKVRHSMTIPIVVGILIALCIALIVCIPRGIILHNKAEHGLLGSSDVADVEIPDFTDKKISEVMNEYEQNGYQFELVYVNEYYSEYDIDLVLKQEPKAGSKKIKANGKITLYINRPQGEAVVPDVQGQHINGAEKTLNTAGFYELRVITVHDENVDEGKVISSFPEQGTKAALDSPIYLYVAGKNPQSDKISVNYHSVAGLTEEEAKEVLVKLGFEEKNIHVDRASNTGKPKGEVVYTSILSAEIDKESIKDETIVIYVSDGTPLVNVEISIKKPSGATDSTKLKVFVNGKVFNFTNNGTSYEEINLNWLMNGTLTIPGYNGTTSEVKVLLDGEPYALYNVDFTDKSYTEELYEYNNPNNNSGSADDTPQDSTEAATSESVLGES